MDALHVFHVSLLLPVHLLMIAFLSPLSYTFTTGSGQSRVCKKGGNLYAIHVS